MKSIPISKNLVATVSDEDYFDLMQYKWTAKRGRKTFYAYRRKKSTEDGPTHILMHRQILGETCSKVFIDHNDMNGLNNCRSNLRICTKAENAMNSMVKATSKTGYKGVTYFPSCGRFRARITFQGKRISLGLYSSAEEAAIAYDEAAKRYFSGFSKPNF